MIEKDRGEIGTEKGEVDGGLGPDLVLGHHQDLEQKIRVRFMVEMTETIILDGKKDGQMMVGGVHEEMIGIGKVNQRNRMKIQEKKKVTSVQMLMIQILLINIEITVPVGLQKKLILALIQGPEIQKS